MAYLACTDLAVGYTGKPVASGITFHVGPGDALCIVGENGAGKTTLLKTLLGLIPPLSGSFEFGDGVSAGKVGYLPQRSDSQRDFPASAWEIVLSGRVPTLEARPFHARADREATARALALVGAEDLGDLPFGILSGGQKQRVLLARAMASEPLLLVLDEPTTGLDPDASASLYEAVDRLRERAVGVISVTHDVAGALPHATHILALGEGTVAFETIDEWNAREGGGAWVS